MSLVSSLVIEQEYPTLGLTGVLGHSTITTTLDVYSHVTPGLQEAAAMAFDQAYSAEPPAQKSLGAIKT